MRVSPSTPRSRRRVMVTEVTGGQESEPPRPPPVHPFPDLSTSLGRNIICLNMLPGYSSQYLYHLTLRSTEINTTIQSTIVLRNTFYANSAEILKFCHVWQNVSVSVLYSLGWGKCSTWLNFLFRVIIYVYFVIQNILEEISKFSSLDILRSTLHKLWGHWASGVWLGDNEVESSWWWFVALFMIVILSAQPSDRGDIY